MSILSSLHKFILVGLVSVFALSIVPASAQDNNSRGLVVGPAILELNADRGGSYEFTLNVENNSQNEDYIVSPSVQTFTADDEDGNPKLSSIPSDSPLVNWITFEESNYNLKRGDKVASKFVVTIPENTKPGSYYLAISYSTNSKPLSTNSNIALNKEVSALLFVTVKGQVERNVEFEYLKTDKQIYDPLFDGLLLSYRIKVDGNAYLKPSGNVFVGSDLENPKSTYQLNPNQKIILPNTGRNFNILTSPRVDWSFVSNNPMNTSFKGEGFEVSDFQKKWVGNQKVTARVLYVNNDGEVSQTTAEVDVFFFPWKTILILFVTALVAFGGYITYRSAIKAK